MNEGMEGFGILQLVQDLKDMGMNVTRLVHDKDASTMNQVIKVFEDVSEMLCTSKYYLCYHLLFRSWMQKFQKSSDQIRQGS